MQLSAYSNIFAAGDIIEWKEQKQAAKAAKHGAVVTANVLTYLTEGPLKDYDSGAEMILVTNGKVCIPFFRFCVTLMASLLPIAGRQGIPRHFVGDCPWFVFRTTSQVKVTVGTHVPRAIWTVIGLFLHFLSLLYPCHVHFSRECR